MELFLFCRGEGEPTCELFPLDVEFSVGELEVIAGFCFLFFGTHSFLKLYLIWFFFRFFDWWFLQTSEQIERNIDSSDKIKFSIKLILLL